MSRRYLGYGGRVIVGERSGEWGEEGYANGQDKKREQKKTTTIDEGIRS